MRKKISFLVFIFFIVLASNLWASAKRVLILPFDIYAQQDLSYLKQSLPQMVASRLFSPGKVEPIDPEKVLDEVKKYQRITRDAAIELGKNFQADYVIFGSITQLGDMVSIDAQIVDLSQEKKPAQFFQEIKGLSEIIPQVSRFARKARFYIEGKEEDFYREDLFAGYAGQPYVPGRYHPERGFYGYPVYPYPIPRREEEPKVTRAKPRFGEEDPTYQGLTKNLVIDLSGSKPVIGFAKEDEGNNTSKKETKQSQPNYYSFYPPQALLQLLASSILLLCPSRGILSRKDLEKESGPLEKKRRLLSQCLNLCLNPRFTKLNHPKLLNLPHLRLNPNPNPTIYPQSIPQSIPQQTPKRGKDNPWSWD
jgi:TolB-like protein